MPSVTNKMVNPTPFDVKIRWHAGRTINVPADGCVYLESDQIDDFTDSKPGAEAIRSLLQHLGVFMQTDDRSYEVQALEALNASIESKTQQYRGFIQNARRELREMNLDNDSFQEYVRSHGYERLNEEIEQLKKRAKFLEGKVSEQKAKGRSLNVKWDLSRTIMVLDPPKEFPNKAQMEIFLHENPEVARAHEDYLKRAAEQAKVE